MNTLVLLLLTLPLSGSLASSARPHTPTLPEESHQHGVASAGSSQDTGTTQRILKQNSEGIEIAVSDTVDTEAWQKALAELFGTKLHVSEPRRENGSQILKLSEVFPEWMRQCAGQKSVTTSNCLSVALYAGGWIPSPTSAANSMSADNVLVPSWLAEGTGETIPYESFKRRLRVGDLVSVTRAAEHLTHTRHVYLYLGNGLIFEHNPSDKFQQCRFSRIDDEYLPLHDSEDGTVVTKPYSLDPRSKPIGLHKRKRKDYTTAESTWSKAHPEAAKLVAEIRKDLIHAWNTGRPIPMPSLAQQKAATDAYDLCKSRYFRPERTTEQEHLYLFCFRDIGEWAHHIESHYGIPPLSSRRRRAIQITKPEALILTHTASKWDDRLRTKDTVKSLARAASARGADIVELQHPQYRTSFAAADNPRQVYDTTNGHFAFDVPATHVTVAGGFLELCLRNSVSHILEQWAQRQEPTSFVLTLPARAIVCDAVTEGFLANTPEETQRLDRFMKEKKSAAITLDEWMNLFTDRGTLEDALQKRLDYLTHMSGAPRSSLSRSFPKHRIELYIGGKLARVIHQPKNSSVPTLKIEITTAP